MRATRNDLSEKTRAGVVELLNASLADALDLVLQSKQAHWNVKGPHFKPLHDLFDQVYAAAGEWADDLAERAVALGGVAKGTREVVVESSRLSKYDLGITSGRVHVQAIADALDTFGKHARASIPVADDQLGDAVTADLFTELAAAADEQLWMVEAHLHDG
ncbi:MAG: DNA starvation/stationary phase protection protein Dps [Sandaracinaceae bacterium]|nr:MAG: DNA starvation/stationary phase protection protein Dps [Sandaracinaceae bacterium]